MLNQATWALDLPRPARVVFDRHGKRIFSIAQLQKLDGTEHQENDCQTKEVDSQPCSEPQLEESRDKEQKGEDNADEGEEGDTEERETGQDGKEETRGGEEGKKINSSCSSADERMPPGNKVDGVGEEGGDKHQDGESPSSQEEVKQPSPENAGFGSVSMETETPSEETATRQGSPCADKAEVPSNDKDVNLDDSSLQTEAKVVPSTEQSPPQTMIVHNINDAIAPQSTCENTQDNLDLSEETVELSLTSVTMATFDTMAGGSFVQHPTSRVEKTCAEVWVSCGERFGLTSTGQTGKQLHCCISGLLCK